MTQATFNASDYRGTGPENYEKFFVPAIGGPLASHLVELAALKSGERILDVACGTGVVTRLAAKQVSRRRTGREPRNVVRGPLRDTERPGDRLVRDQR